MNPRAVHLVACGCCGQIHQAPVRLALGEVAECVRCRHVLPGAEGTVRSLAWPAALALSALVLYPLAMALPVLQIEKLGHARASTIWSGVVRMYTDGHWVIGTIVLLCSIVIPLGKITGILALSVPVLRGRFPHRHRALTFRAIDWLGRWGMIDVLLVAVLVAAVKLGDLVSVTPGPGIIAFAGVVLLSLLSSMTFDPRAIWADAPAAAAPASTSNLVRP